LRPKEVGIDDPEEPTIQGALLSALGAEVIDTPYNKVCCGSYQTLQDKYVVSNLAYDILSSAQSRGAEAVVLSCPLCAFNLDSRQKEIKERHPQFREMPVLYFTQLMALALGSGPQAYGFELNAVNPEPWLRDKKLLGEDR